MSDVDYIYKNFERIFRAIAPTAPTPQPLGNPAESRFLLHVTKTAGCWIWTGLRNKCGYGVITLPGRKKAIAHRVAHLLYIGPIASGLQVDHLCRVRECVNPAHLEAVTPKVNTQRSNTPSMLAVRAGECLRGHRFTEHSRFSASGRRVCMACDRERHRRSYHANKLFQRVPHIELPVRGEVR